MCFPTNGDVKSYADPQSYQIWASSTSTISPVFRNTLNTTEVPSYTVLSAMAAKDVNRHLTLRFNANNLADAQYVDRVGGGHFIPGAGRSASLTAGFKF